MAIGGNSAELKVNLTFDNSKAAAALQASLSGLTRQTQNFNRNPIISKNFTQPLGRITGAADEFTKSLEASNARVLAFGASAGAIFAVQKAMSELVKTTITVEQKLTDINALLGKSDKEFKKFSDGLFDIARRTGTAFNEVADSANEFARQGLGVPQTLERTNAALSLARLGMMDSVNATESLTAALNTFKGEVDDANLVVNKLAQVDAAFAVSSKDLAEAIKRTGASASDASVSFNELLAAVTVTQERTARGGAVIGNAFKTIFTRIQRPEVLNQLEQIGIVVRDDVTGEVLPAIQILKQYGDAYGSLTPAVRSNTAQLIAGGRQINILKSLLPELAAGTGKFDSALKVANETTTEATDRLKILTSTTQGTLNAVQANLTKVASEIGTLSIKPAIDNILKALDTITDLVGPSNFFGLGETIGKGVYEGIGKVLSGPGIILLATVLAKLGANLLSFVKTSGAQFLGLNKQAEEQARTQSIIGNILAQRPEVMQKILSGQLSTNDAAKIFSNELRRAEVHYENLNKLASQLAAKQSLFQGPSKKKGLASGLIPNFVPNFAADDAEAERKLATQGGYRAGQIRRMNMPGMGPVTYNGKEDVKKFPGMEQPAIMPPALSSAGKDYRSQFKNVIGFDPYNEKAAFGFVPNFNLNKIGDGVLRGAMSSGYFTADEKKIIGNQNMDDLRSTYKATNVKNNPSLGAFRNKLLGLGGKAEAGREAAKLTAQIKKEATQGGEIDIAGRIGLLSMFGANNPAATTSTTLGQLSAFNEVLDAARATDSTGKNADILSNAQITFKNVQVRSLEKASEDLANDKNEVYEKFRGSLNKNLLPVLSKIGAESIAPILGNQGPKVAEIKKKLKTSGSSLLPPGAEGDIFEQVIRLATKSPSAFVKSLGDDFRAPFDFEEDGQAGYQFRKQFFGKKGFDMKALVKADAKRTADPKSTRSLIKKAYNQAILAEKSDERDLIRQFNLPYAGSTVSVVDPKTGRTAGPIKQTRRTKAGGHVPNFSLKGVSNAIEREDRAGVRRDKIRVGYDRRLAASGGLGVYNTDEGSLGNAINMHMAAGRNKSQIQRQGKAEGFIPNFAKGLPRGRGRRLNTETSDPLMGVSAAANRASLALDESADKVSEETDQRDRGIGSLAGMIIVGGQLSSFGDKLKQSESALTQNTGALISFGGQLAMYVPTVETALDVFTGANRDLAGHLKAAGQSVSSFAAGLSQSVTARGGGQFTGSAVASAAGSFIGGSSSIGRLGGAALGRGREAFAAGGKGILGRVGAFQKGLAAAGKTIARFGGIIGKVVGGILRFAGPVGVVVTALLAAKKVFDIFTKSTREANEAAEKASEDLDKRMLKSRTDYDRTSSSLDRLKTLQSSYVKALKEEETQKAKLIKQEFDAELVNSGLGLDTRRRLRADFASGDPTKINEAQAELIQRRKEQETQEQLTRAIRDLSKFADDRDTDEFRLAQADFAASVTKLAARLDAGGLKTLEGIDINDPNRTLETEAKGFGQSVGAIFASDKARNKEFVKDFRNGLAPVLENLSAENRATIETLLKSMGVSRDEEVAETLKLLEPSIKQSAKALGEQRRGQGEGDRRLAEEEARKRLLAQQKAATKELIAYNKQLRTQERLLQSTENIYKQTLTFEQERLKLIQKGNEDTLKKIRSQFAVSDVTLQNELIQNQRSFTIKRVTEEQKAQREIRAAANSVIAKEVENLDKERGAGAGIDTIQNVLKPLTEQIRDAAAQGGSTADLIGIINEFRKSATVQTAFGKIDDGGVIQSGIFKALEESVTQSSQGFANVLRELADAEKQQGALIRERNKQLREQIFLEQKLNFGGKAASSPESFIDQIRQARIDVFQGARRGQADRQTAGLETLAKQFQGLSLGGVNPGEQFLGGLTNQYASNLEKASSELLGRALNSKELEEVKEIAKLKAEAFIKPNKPLTDNTVALGKATKAIVGLARGMGLNMADGGDMSGASRGGAGPSGAGRDYSRSGPSTGGRMSAPGSYSNNRIPAPAGGNFPLLGPSPSETQRPRMLQLEDQRKLEDMKRSQVDPDEVATRQIRGLARELFQLGDPDLMSDRLRLTDEIQGRFENIGGDRLPAALELLLFELERMRKQQEAPDSFPKFPSEITTPLAKMQTLADMGIRPGSMYTRDDKLRKEIEDLSRQLLDAQDKANQSRQLPRDERTKLELEVSRLKNAILKLQLELGDKKPAKDISKSSGMTVAGSMAEGAGILQARITELQKKNNLTKEETTELKALTNAHKAYLAALKPVGKDIVDFNIKMREIGRQLSGMQSTGRTRSGPTATERPAARGTLEPPQATGVGGGGSFRPTASFRTVPGPNGRPIPATPMVIPSREGTGTKEGSELATNLKNTNQLFSNLGESNNTVLQGAIDARRRTFDKTDEDLDNARIQFQNNLITSTELLNKAQDKLNASYGDGEKFAEALSEALGARFQYNLATFQEQSGQLITGVVDDFKSGTKEAFGEAIRGTASLKEAFSKVFDQILDNILDKSLDMGVDAVFGAIGAGFGFKKGGRVKGYNAGGFVNQGSGVRDDVPAMMQGGEYVIRKSSVNKYGRGMFDALNSGGRVGYAMGDRIMQNRLRPEFVYNDPKRPTGGSYRNLEGLSAFALMESGSPMIGIQQEREKALESYIRDKKAYDEMVRKAQDQFKKQQKARMKSTLISVGLQAAAFGIGEMGAGAGKDMSAVGGEAAPGTPVDVVDYRAGFGAKGGLMTNNGFVRGFARGGRNRDNIPAMLMGGEYVVNKRSVDKYGVGLFNDLNNGRAQGFANGGMVGGDGGGVGGAPTTANNNFEINITMNGNGEGETTTSSNQNENQSQEDQERNEQLGMAVKNAVQTELIEQQRPGGLLYREDRI